MKKVIVTGGAGFIGSNLVKGLVKKGYEVTVIDNLYSGYLSNLEEVMDKINFINLDISSQELDILYNLENIYAIFHLAAIPSVNLSVEKPVQVHNTNVNGTLNMLDFARNKKISKFIYSASSAAYGETGEVLNTESMLPAPVSPYGVSKLVGEYYASVYSKLYGMETVSLRYFNVFGPGQRPDSEYAAVIPKFIYAAVNQKKLTVFGNGEQTRDFTFVKDIVKANISCLDKTLNGDVINVATGKSVSLNFLLDCIRNVSGKTLDVEYASERKGDIKHSRCDSDKALNLLGFKAEHDFEKGIESTYKWFSE